MAKFQFTPRARKKFLRPAGCLGRGCKGLGSGVGMCSYCKGATVWSPLSYPQTVPADGIHRCTVEGCLINGFQEW